MKKRNLIFILLTFILLLIVYQSINISDTNVNLSIQNDSDMTLKDLNIYCNDTKIGTIYTIEPKKHVNFKFDFPKDFTEGEILLKYNDSSSQKEVTLCGYIENNAHKKISLRYTNDNNFNVN